METCLINSINLSDWYQIDREEAIKYMPIGLASLGAVLEKSDFEVSIIDFNYDIEDGSMEISDDFFVEAANRIIERSPDIVGFSTMCNSFHLTLAIAREVKRKSRHTAIILGGPQASIVDERTLTAFPFIDMILRGEAEYTLPPLVQTIRSDSGFSDIPGLTFRRNGGVVRNPDPPIIDNLDELPIPAYHLFPFEISSVATIDAGRGCPFTCKFCSTSKYWRRRSRLKSTDRVLEEMTMLNETYGVTHFSLLHDMLTTNNKWIESLCEGITTAASDIKWSCSARPDCVNPQMLKAMADSGCDGIFYGIETGSPRMQRKSGKMLNLNNVIPIIEASLDVGIRSIVSFITGFPDEREEDLMQTLEMALKITSYKNVLVQLHLLAPVKETPYYDEFYDRLRFDGHFSDFVGTGLNSLDVDWFIEYPDLFSTFYYYDNDALPRRLIKDLDKFMNVFCNVLRSQLQSLAEQGFDIWELYVKWKEWSEKSPSNATEETPFDLFIMGLYDYLCYLADNDLIEIDAEQARDDILKFFFNHYHRVRVFQKEFPAVEDSTASGTNEGARLSHSQT